MDPLEKKIRDKFTSIEIDGEKILETEAIHSIEVKEKTAYIQLLLNSKQRVQQKNIQNKINHSLLEIQEIDNIQFHTSADEQEAQTKLQANKDVSSQANPQNTTLLQNYENIIVVASGKGELENLPVALNLALALHELGYTTALFDADIYGPSIPMMMGTRNQLLSTNQGKLLPLEKYGIEFMSIGNLVKEGDSIVWRGPMVHQAIHQMLRDTAWSGGDFMIMDLPPGTGDVQISISQIVQVRGAVIVSTPQDLALMDARRAMIMFEKVNIPILGMVENMKHFICPKCGEKTAIFGEGGTKTESKNLQFSFLGGIPIDLKIRESGDKGVPLMSLDKANSDKVFQLRESYLELAKNFYQTIYKK